jgi:hypothetical protein
MAQASLAHTKVESAARLRTIAAQFRAHAAETDWPLYHVRMLQTAKELELEASKLDGYRRFALAS